MADYVWKPIVLIEMKRRVEDLSRHFRRAFDYWVRLVPGRPRYVVLCNFDEFWIYDFETQMDSPVDQLKVEDLSRRYGPLAFRPSNCNAVPHQSPGWRSARWVRPHLRRLSPRHAHTNRPRLQRRATG